MEAEVIEIPAGTPLVLSEWAVSGIAHVPVQFHVTGGPTLLVDSISSVGHEAHLYAWVTRGGQLLRPDPDDPDNPDGAILADANVGEMVMFRVTGPHDPSAGETGPTYKLYYYGAMPRG